MKTLFTKHPDSVGETYWEHFRTAMFFSGKLLMATTASAIHACFPFFFTKTGSEIIAQLHDRMVVNRTRQRVK